MAYKMDPTKPKKKNGGIKKIVKGIAEAIALGPAGSVVKFGYEAFKQTKQQTPILPSIQYVPQHSHKGKAKDKKGATATQARTKYKGKAKKSMLQNYKRTPANSVRPIKVLRDVEPSAKNTNIKGAILESGLAGASAAGKKPPVVKAKPKKVKVKIKNNKTKIKIKN